ncbi:MAG TPA: hypothetical protein VII33_17485 [Nakamurella sp.]
MPLLIRRADLLAEGTSDNDIRRARRIGTLTALAPGSYLPPGEAQHLNRSDRHRLALEAVLPRLSGNPVVSHVSAALLHDLPVPLGNDPSTSSGRARRSPVGAVASSRIGPSCTPTT